MDGDEEELTNKRARAARGSRNVRERGVYVTRQGEKSERTRKESILESIFEGEGG